MADLLRLKLYSSIYLCPRGGGGGAQKTETSKCSRNYLVDHSDPSQKDGSLPLPCPPIQRGWKASTTPSSRIVALYLQRTAPVRYQSCGSSEHRPQRPAILGVPPNSPWRPRARFADPPPGAGRLGQPTASKPSAGALCTGTTSISSRPCAAPASSWPNRSGRECARVSRTAAAVAVSCHPPAMTTAAIAATTTALSTPARPASASPLQRIQLLVKVRCRILSLLPHLKEMKSHEGSTQPYPPCYP